MNLDKLKNAMNNISEETNVYVECTMDILDRIQELLDKNFDGKQKLLAQKMGKTEAEISKMLSGVQNFTVKTLIKLQIALGSPIIAVCTDSEMENFCFVKHQHNTLHRVTNTENEEKEFEYETPDVKRYSFNNATMSQYECS